VGAMLAYFKDLSQSLGSSGGRFTWSLTRRAEAHKQEACSEG
jgi:hypothetical protein